MKNCPSNKILNPTTNRCVLKSGLIGKKLLKSYLNNKCNKIKLNWENNSCYIDSLLVALFINKDKFINKIDDICDILNNDNFRMTFNMTKFDKQQIYENNNINTKLLLSKINNILKFISK